MFTYLSIHSLLFIFFHISSMWWTNEQTLLLIVDEGQILQGWQIVTKVSQTACPQEALVNKEQQLLQTIPM